MAETIFLGLVLVALLVFAVSHFRSHRRDDRDPEGRPEHMRKARGEAEAWQASRYWNQ